MILQSKICWRFCVNHTLSAKDTKIDFTLDKFNLSDLLRLEAVLVHLFSAEVVQNE